LRKLSKFPCSITRAGSRSHCEGQLRAASEYLVGKTLMQLWGVLSFTEIDIGSLDSRLLHRFILAVCALARWIFVFLS
jgi:hypothetical protein